MAREQILNRQHAGHYRNDLTSPSDGFSIITKSPRQLSINQRERANALHQPIANSTEMISQGAVAKTLQGAKELTEGAMVTSSSVFSSVLGGLKNIIQIGSNNGNIRDVVFATIGSIFGLKSILSLFNAPKFIGDKKFRETTSPLIFSGAKFITGAALAYGLFKTVMGGAGLGGPGMVIGLISFLAFNMFTNIYENPNSIFSKIATVLGVRDSMIEIMDSMKIEKTLYD